MRTVVSLVILCAFILSLGCARVRVEAPKEPIKVDISMRLDVYQHVTQDINAIEDMVSGSGTKDKGSFMRLFCDNAYAQEGLSPEVEQAALRRRERLSALSSGEQQGVIGENKSGMVEIRQAGKADASVEALINAENSDRMIIYQAIAKKNNTPVADVQKLYAKRLQQDAASGTPIEVLNEATGQYEWKTK